ncbi:MAG: carboxypeptidase-like regulatory domain-containing protein [Chitinophagaceae bacterium]|nr:carboxypeptidase-like regulatory domain-containing protein [Chitinophagaceae bacterium]
MRFCIGFLFLFFSSISHAQKKSAFVSGKVIDENENPLSKVSITLLGKQTGTLTTDSGTFNIKVPANRALALLFSFAGYKDEQRNFYLNENEKENLTVKLERGGRVLETVLIQDERERNETGLTKINPKNALILPGAIGGVEGLIKILVGSNNELTSQYNVRGGNYDENLIYINDFEIFRPYLVRSGQQEGLSFINPELARNINFYNGGFQSKHGDKISSVLDIQYKKPKTFGGSAYISLLEQGFHIEGSAKKEKFTYLLGVRNRTNRNLLASQEIKGNYVPSSSDLQAYFTYKFTEKFQLELLSVLSVTRFLLVPESAQKSTAVFSPLFTANLALDIFFEGREKDNYNSKMVGLSAVHQPNKNLSLKWMVSRFENNENENFDIAGAYLFGERDFDKSKTTYGQIVNPSGAGVFQNYARNKLNIQVWNVSHKASFYKGKHFIQWGVGVDHTLIKDKLNEWEFQDSAGYSLPFSPGSITLNKVLKSIAALTINKYSGYVQDNIRVGDSLRNFTLQAGVRFNYNSLNSELIVSPRVQLSYKPNWQKDVIFKAASGIYNQPPFYRELRRYDGTINPHLKSQKSYQIVAGVDYNFKKGRRPYRLTTEAYYKSLTNVVPYDIDNVRIRYFGTNSAKAYATGIELRLFSELVKDAESWLSIGIMRTKENLDNDFYYRYKNAAGDFITSQSTDQAIADSVQTTVGYVRRPSDRLLTLGLFLQDYLTTNKNFKVHLNMLYGSNMSYNIPNSIKYRNALIIEPYFRVDIGFSALLLSERSLRRSHSPFHSVKNIWVSLEVFNLIDRANTISYQLIKDFANNTFSIPNRLTPRLLNFKLLARF